MAPYYVIPSGEAGALAGTSVYLFRFDQRDVAAEAALSLTEDAEGNVVVRDLPPDTSIPWSLLWTYSGQAGVHRFGKLANPSGLVLPILDAGVVVGDLGLVFYVAGVGVAAAPTLAPLSPVGYYLSGLVADSSGEVRVYYEYPPDVRQVVPYEVDLTSLAAGSGFDWLEERVMEHAAAWWPGSGLIEYRDGQSIAPPTIAPENGTHVPSADEPWMEVDWLWHRRVQHGTAEHPVYEAEGSLQFTVYVDQGAGTGYLARAMDRVEPMLAAAAVPGLHWLAAMPPIAAPGPPEGFYGRILDVRFLWFWEPV